MGRKPNQVILHYFSRGPKLDDYSNRYEHTCKACGDVFPKGRIEGLINHLTKKCPSLSVNQRTDIVVRFYDLVERSNTLPPENETGNNMDERRPVSLPFSPTKQSFNSLNILAEASRRVGANDPPKHPRYPSMGPAHAPSLALDPSLDMETFARTFLNEEEALATGVNGVTSAALPASFPYVSIQPSSTHGGPQQNISPVDRAVAYQEPGLSSIAATASGILPPESDLDMSQNSIENALFHPVTTASPSQSTNQGDQPAQSSSVAASAMQLDKPRQPILLPAGQPPRPLVIVRDRKGSHFVSESGTSAKPQKPKVRGKFSPIRRDEVRQMRHTGACLRCRMLKKTCSNGDPCQACAAVETPRIWKHRCLRTKLVNEFSLYSSGLHATLAYHETARVKHQNPFSDYNGKLEIYHFDESPQTLSFKADQGMVDPSFLDPDYAQGDGPMNAVRPVMCFIIDVTKDNSFAQLDAYIKLMYNKFLAREKNPLLRVTMRTAAHLTEAKNDILLRKVLQLCSCAMMIVDPDLQWQIVANPEPSDGTGGDQSQYPVPLTTETSPISKTLITSQLRGVVEKHAGVLAKSILVEFEKRLLQRQHERQFETFLATILLLNSFERMCWLYKTWEGRESDKWPFPEKSPASFTAEGERFAEITDVLVEMRNLPPRSFFDPMKHTLVPYSSSEEVVCKWFEEIAITQNYLQLNSERPFDGEDFHSMDGRFFSRLLRPDSERQIKDDGTVKDDATAH